MSGIMESVNQRTQMVGQNRLELLLFRLHGKQIYGINVFKVKEVLTCPKLTQLPHSHRVIRGIAHIRGSATSIIDMSMAIGGPKIEDTSTAFVIIAEYNRTVTGFMVNAVERIINMKWSDILPPPRGAGKNSYLTAITKMDEHIVEIIDVEQILSEINPPSMEISEEQLSEGTHNPDDPRVVLISDDSAVARKQIQRTVEQLGIKSILAKDGLEALNILKEMATKGSIYEQLIMVISDIEMPEMDGYTFTTEVRADHDLKDLHILLHTSLSGVFNKAMVEKVGADNFIPKFDPDELAAAVQSQLNDKDIPVSE
ncbi:MAG: two-component system chemotaxis response regulator CheV [Enterobacterales bacterium]|jgi:two-component system chemotaxis response regulator CheV